jgi:hypothetical protein
MHLGIETPEVDTEVERLEGDRRAVLTDMPGPSTAAGG